MKILIDIEHPVHVHFFKETIKDLLSKVHEIQILENNDSNREWKQKRERLLADKTNVLAWMTDFINDYPESYRKYRIKNGGKK